jgi:ABC-type transport system involved in cytochrome bd biosynthesis fused ATPase/permease subunit
MILDPSLMPIIIAVIAGLLAMLALALAWLAIKFIKLKREHEDLADAVHGSNSDLRDFQGVINVVNERGMATDLRINALDDQLHRLAKKVDDFQQSESSNHAYAQAIQKVRSGASVAELMQSAGLSQDEAALLVRLHGPKTQ